MPANGRLTTLFARHVWLWAAVGLTVALQAAILARSPVIALDGITFVEMAVALEADARQAVQAFDQHPGYPALMLAAARVGAPLFDAAGTGSLVWAGRLVSALCGVLSVVLVWLLTRRIFDARIAGVAAVIFAGLPLVRQNAADVLSDTPHLALYLLAAWCIACGLDSARREWFVAGGAASGLAFWIRPEGLSVAMVAVLLACCWLIRPHSFSRLRTLGCVAAVGCAAAIVVAPYLVVAGKFTSKKDLTAGRQKPAQHQLPYVDATASAANPELSEVPIADTQIPATSAAGAAATPSTRARIQAAIAKYVEEIGYCFKYVLLIPLALGHLAPSRQRPHLPPYILVWSLALFHSALLLWLHYSAGYIGHRHVIPLVALGMPFVASGICYMVEQACRSLDRSGWRRWAVAAAAAGVVIAFLPRTLRPLNHVGRPVVEAAHWVALHREPSSRVLSNSLYTRFYAEMPGDVLGVDAGDVTTALAGAGGRSSYDFVVLEVDARRYQIPRRALHDRGFAQVLHLDGGRHRPWHQVSVYRFEPKMAQAQDSPSESGAKAASRQ